MSINNLPQLAPGELEPSVDLITVYHKKTGEEMKLQLNAISTPLPSGVLKTSLPLSSTLQVVKDGSETQSTLRISTVDLTNYGSGAKTGNTAFGQNALITNTTGNYNLAIGRDAMVDNTTGGNNTALGAYALSWNT